MKKLAKKVMSSSFLVGMASIFCPSVIEIEPMKCNKNSDMQNIANDWKQLGVYMTKAYESIKQ